MFTTAKERHKHAINIRMHTQAIMYCNWVLFVSFSELDLTKLSNDQWTCHL